MLKLKFVTTLSALSVCLFAQSAPPNVYLVHNLVSDLSGIADHQDANLQNPWGNGFGATPFWVGNNGTGTSTLYDGYGTKSALTVNIPGPGGAATGGAVSGVIFSAGAAAFNVNGKPSSFLFCSEDGLIAGWNGGSNAVTLVDNSAGGAVYKGCAIASTPAGPVLYAANFNAGRIDAWDGKLNPSPFGAGAFANTVIPAGFAPFNIQLLGNYLYVTYAKQDSKKHDDVAGVGNGYVALFDLTGNLMGNLVSKGPLNSPWAVALAPANFGAFPGALLVGNFGDGNINAFNPLTGAMMGTLNLMDATGKAANLTGLWSLNFGSGASNEDSSTLYFTAGIGGGPNNDPVETHGLLGSIQPVPSVKAAGVVNGASFLPAPLAPNTYMTAFGGAMAPVSAAAATLSTSVGGVKVTVNGEAADVASVSNTGVTFLVPADLTPGTAQVVVTNNGLASTAVTAPAAMESPAFFTIGAVGTASYIAAEHADGSVIAPATVSKTATTAKGGETIALFGTGFGSAVASLSNPPIVLVGGIQANVTYAGMIAPGLYQINVTLPTGLPTGDAEVIATIGNAATQGGVFVTVGQ